MSLRIAPNIEAALSRGAPVVALESTVLTHGLPRPQNLRTALELEAVVRSEGATPATVAVVAGELVVGVEEAELELLASQPTDKASLWNLGALLASGKNAGTTVAATLHAAAAVGIQVFATGGIGGVHHLPFDESADLGSLARYGVLTVCSGPKSILLADATLERLETLGVPVIGYRSDRLAGFYLRETEIALPARFDTPADVALAFRHHLNLGLRTGMLVSNPVSVGLESDELDRYQDRAEQEAREAKVTGKRLTPFLLARLAELSRGRSVETNLRLLRENAALAARVAMAMKQSAVAAATTTGATDE